MEKITFCIPSKNNLRYLKTCLPSIRKNASRNDHDIIVFVDSDNDGTVEWLKENAEQYNVTYYINPELGTRLFGIGKAYDFCIENSKTDVCMIFHADMMLGKDADVNAFKHLGPKKVVCSTRIEPPLHPPGPEKITLAWGNEVEDYVYEDCKNYFLELEAIHKNKTTNGIFAPWCMYKSDYLAIGGHDELFAPQSKEDSDLFNRFVLNGYNVIQSWDGLVYHFTSRGSRFNKHAGGAAGKNSNEWIETTTNNGRNFVRKWGMPISSFIRINYFYKETFKYKKYKIGVKFKKDTLVYNNLFNLDLKEDETILPVINFENFTSSRVTSVARPRENKASEFNRLTGTLSV